MLLTTSLVINSGIAVECTHQLNCPEELFSPFVVLHHVRQREVILLDVVTQFRIDLHQDWVSHLQGVRELQTSSSFKFYLSICLHPRLFIKLTLKICCWPTYMHICSSRANCLSLCQLILTKQTRIIFSLPYACCLTPNRCNAIHCLIWSYLDHLLNLQSNPTQHNLTKPN